MYVHVFIIIFFKLIIIKKILYYLQEMFYIDGNDRINDSMITKDYLEGIMNRNLSLFDECKSEEDKEDIKLYEEFCQNLVKDVQIEENTEDKLLIFEENIKKFQAVFLLKNISGSDISLCLDSNSTVLSSNKKLKNIIEVFFFQFWFLSCNGFCCSIFKTWKQFGRERLGIRK